MADMASKSSPKSAVRMQKATLSGSASSPDKVRILRYFFLGSKPHILSCFSGSRYRRDVEKFQYQSQGSRARASMIASPFNTSHGCIHVHAVFW